MKVLGKLLLIGAAISLAISIISGVTDLDRYLVGSWVWSFAFGVLLMEKLEENERE